MKPIQKLLALSLCALYVGCTETEVGSTGARTAEFIRLHTHGGWGFDGDIWLYPDDSFRVRYYDSSSGEISEDRGGSKDGVFSDIVALADSTKAWDITTRSLEADIEKADEDGKILGVTDSNHVFLEFRLQNRTLVADFYASRAFAETYPKASQVAAFAALEKAIFSAVKKR